MRLLFVLMMWVPFLLLGELEWASELPGGFSASVRLPKARISIDEDLILELTLRYPSTHTPDLDTIRMNLLKYVGVAEPPFSLGEEVVEVSGETGGERTSKVVFRIEPQLAQTHFVSFYNIPFLPLEKGSQDIKEIISEIFEVEVFLAKIDPAYRGHLVGLLPLTDPFPIGLNRSNQLRLFNPDLLKGEARRSTAIVRARSIPWKQLMGVLLFCALVLIARMQPKQGPDFEKEKGKRAVSARGKAMRALKGLDVDLSEKEPFYVDVTRILRTYIEERYRIEATTQTTQEFLIAMAHNPPLDFDRETQAMLSDFMVGSDRIKFAKRRPTREECLEARRIAERLIGGSG